MYHKSQCFLPIFLFFLIFSINSYAEESPSDTECSIQDRICILEEIAKDAASIDNAAWRDQTYREVAKTLAFDGAFEKSVAVISLVENPDTKAMTIRGIGMALAPQKHDQESLNAMFTVLREEAEKIKHPPSYAIALTYIAMSQAFADDNEGAWKTAADMKNNALRHKAYGETAEIQAEKGNFKAAQTSIERIESLAFRNKAYSIVSKILSDKELFEDAYKAANAITNPYKKAQALQYILDIQKPREVKR